MENSNIFSELPRDLTQEVFEKLVSHENIRIERIISKGQRSPKNGWFDQSDNEWVIVLKGEARLVFEDDESIHLTEGDYINISAHKKHKVEWTTPEQETIWLAIHY